MSRVVSSMFIVAFIFLIVSVGMLISIYQMQTSNLTCPKPLECPGLLELAQERFIETHTYANNYKCGDFSKDWSTVLTLLGYESYYYVNVAENHAYVLQAVEPQTGKLRELKRVEDKGYHEARCKGCGWWYFEDAEDSPQGQGKFNHTRKNDK